MKGDTLLEFMTDGWRGVARCICLVLAIMPLVGIVVLVFDNGR